MKNSNHIIRKVSKRFHELCIDTLPDSVNIIYDEGYNQNIIDCMLLVDRNGKIVWDSNSKDRPGEIYYKCLSNVDYLDKNDNNPNISYDVNKREMEGLDVNDAINKLKQVRNDIVDVVSYNNSKERKM